MTLRDPIVAVTHPDPYAYYADLVARTPLYWDETSGLWVAASAAAVTAVLTSECCRVRPPAEPVPAALLGTPAGDIFGRLVRMNDGPDHRPLKRAITTTLGDIDGTRVAGKSRAWARVLAREITPEDQSTVWDFAFRLPREDPAVQRASLRPPFEGDLIPRPPRDEEGHDAPCRPDPGTTPRVDGRVEEAHGNAIDAGPRRIPQRATRDDEHVDDGPPVQRPSEVPLPRHLRPRPVRPDCRDVDIPGADELAEELEPVAEIRVRPGRAQGIDHRVEIHPFLSPFALSSLRTAPTMRAYPRTAGAWGAVRPVRSVPYVQPVRAVPSP